MTSRERAEMYLQSKLGDRRGFDLWSFVGEDEDLEQEVIAELESEFAATRREALEDAWRACDDSASESGRIVIRALIDREADA